MPFFGMVLKLQCFNLPPPKEEHRAAEQRRGHGQQDADVEEEAVVGVEIIQAIEGVRDAGGRVEPGDGGGVLGHLVADALHHQAGQEAADHGQADEQAGFGYGAQAGGGREEGAQGDAHQAARQAGQQHEAEMRAEIHPQHQGDVGQGGQQASAVDGEAAEQVGQHHLHLFFHNVQHPHKYGIHF